MLSQPLADAAITGLGLAGAAILPSRAKLALLRGLATLAKGRMPLVLLGTAAAILVARLCCLPFLPRPTPIVPDEFSHLLVAETLAGGRLSNPAHPMWRHFETLFVLQRPTHASAYPPVQGMILASGLLVAGDPWFGVLLGVAGMCAAIVWMLRAYVTPFWALYGGLLAGAGYGLVGYWANSYWGGAGAAIGGALLFGAVPRIASGARAGNAAVLAAGIFVLANSRPYEGFLICLPAASWLAWTFARKPEHTPKLPLLVLAAVIIAGTIMTCWYNLRVTKRALLLPYNAYIQQYAASPAFIWQSPREAPAYGDKFLRDAHLSFRREYEEYSSLRYTAVRSTEKLAGIADFYVGPFWPVVLVLLPDMMRQRRVRLLLVSLALCLSGILLTVGFHRHYAAPCTCIFILLMVEAFRRVHLWSRPAGIALLISAPVSWLAVQILEMHTPRLPSSVLARPAIQARIAAERGQHIVFVHYGPHHPLGEEWVYNPPDIDRAQIIWARDMGHKQNRELIEYFPGRTLWTLEPDWPGVRLSRYTSTGTAADWRGAVENPNSSSTLNARPN